MGKCEKTSNNHHRALALINVIPDAAFPHSNHPETQGRLLFTHHTTGTSSQKNVKERVVHILSISSKEL